MIDDDAIVILKNVILKTFKITKSLIWKISLQSSKKSNLFLKEGATLKVRSRAQGHDGGGLPG